MDRRYFVLHAAEYVTPCFVPRVHQLPNFSRDRTSHRKYLNSFSAKYRTWRLVYYEEFGDAETAHDRERQLKGWSRAKKEALIVKMNPRWRDLIAEWEEKYGLEFRLDGRIVKKGNPPAKVKTKDPSTPVSRARPPQQSQHRRLLGTPDSKARGNPPALRMRGYGFGLVK